MSRNKKTGVHVIALEQNVMNFVNPNDISNTFNTFFGTIDEKIANGINTPTGETSNLPPRHNKTFYLHYTSKSEILKIIQKLQNKAGGADGTSTIVLKALAKHICVPLEHI